MKRRTDQWGISPTVDYIADRKTNTAPVVVESFTDDELIEWYILENGNHILADRYNPKWKGGSLVKKHIPKDTVLRIKGGKTERLT
jgi:hypothetical protein